MIDEVKKTQFFVCGIRLLVNTKCEEELGEFINCIIEAQDFFRLKCYHLINVLSELQNTCPKPSEVDIDYDGTIELNADEIYKIFCSYYKSLKSTSETYTKERNSIYEERAPLKTLWKFLSDEDKERFTFKI